MWLSFPVKAIVKKRLKNLSLSILYSLGSSVCVDRVKEVLFVKSKDLWFGEIALSHNLRKYDKLHNLNWLHS